MKGLKQALCVFGVILPIISAFLFMIWGIIKLANNIPPRIPPPPPIEDVGVQVCIEQGGIPIKRSINSGGRLKECQFKSNQ